MMRNNILVIIILLSAVFCGCRHNPRSGKGVASPIVEHRADEDFQSFLAKFQQDSVFQYERIIFPLKNSLYNFDTNSFDEKIITKNDWVFTNFANLPANYLRNIMKISDNEFSYNIQIEDTGVSVNYIFNINNRK